MRPTAIHTLTTYQASWPGEKTSSEKRGNAYKSIARAMSTAAVSAGTMGTRRTRNPRAAARWWRRSAMRAMFTKAYRMRKRIPAAAASPSIESGRRKTRPNAPPASCAGTGVWVFSRVLPRTAGRPSHRAIVKDTRDADARFEAPAVAIARPAAPRKRTTGHPVGPAIEPAANNDPSSGSLRSRGPAARHAHAVDPVPPVRVTFPRSTQHDTTYTV